MDAHLNKDQPNLAVIKAFWQRRTVDGVGLALRLNWQEPNPVGQALLQQKNNQLKDIRTEAIKLFTGTGAGNDGVFGRA